MHATAPSSNLALHEGQFCEESDGISPEPSPLAGLAAGAAGLFAGPAGALPTAAPTPAGAGVMNGCLHIGHETRFPSALSGSCIAFRQCGHLMICGMFPRYRFFFSENRSELLPTRIKSPERSATRPETFLSLTNVPPDEPKSSTR